MIKIAILGATGYTGVELLRLLSNHSEVEVIFASSETFTGKKISEVYPSLFLEKEIILESFDNSPDFITKLAKKIDLVFLALPPGKASSIVPYFLDEGVKVIDLSADFRIKNSQVFEKWYQVSAAKDKYLSQAVYGLPEIYRMEIQKADLIANPGCYPTVILLSLIPLLKEKIISSDIIIDAKSGVSGAGRTPKETNIFAYCNENFLAYSIEGHRHQCEVEQELAKFTNDLLKIIFQTHLVPMTRGIFSTIYCNLKKEILEKEVREIYQKYYGQEKFIRLLPEGIWPATKNVWGSNYLDLNFKIKPEIKKIIIFSVIDNLVKGASGQAVQNMNLIMGFEETLGLLQKPVYP